MIRTMAPLFVPRSANDPPLFNAIERHLEAYYAAGVFGSTEVHVVARLIHRAWPRIEKRGAEMSADLALAMALAVRAPTHAHVCVDLATITGAELLGGVAYELGDALPTLPQDRGRWISQLRTLVELVRGPKDPSTTPFVLDGSWLYIDRSWRYQERILTRIESWAPIECVNWSEDVCAGLDILFQPPGEVAEDAMILNRQRLAAAMALRNRLTVITGGPGMGKTWTVRNLIALLFLEHQRCGTDRPLQIALAAPTGKAAVRIRESLLDGMPQEFIPALERFLSEEIAEEIATFVSEIQASTLHRLLGVRPDNSSRFRHHQGAPLPFDVIIVDEVSMVDFRMMAKLVDAVADRPDRPIRLILLGDRDQLASVEAGTVLADLCGPTTAQTIRLSRELVESLPEIVGLRRLQGPAESTLLEWRAPGMDDRVVQFNQTYRFSADSGIKRFADACVAQPFDKGTALDALGDSRSSDTQLIGYGPKGPPAAINDIIRSEYRPYLELLKHSWWDHAEEFPSEEVYHRRLLERFDAFRILCAFRRGRMGVAGMNERVTRLLATHPIDEISLEPSEEFWPGKPIMVTRNDYSVGRFNGDIGVVVSRSDHEGNQRLFVAFPGQDSLPSEDKVTQRGYPLDQREHCEQNLVEYLPVSRLPEHDTVFAMTIHKSQGSQFGHVMVVLPDQTERSSILTRELIYTGVTRASQRVTVLGDRELLGETLSSPVQRASQLGAKLWQQGEGFVP